MLAKSQKIDIYFFIFSIKMLNFVATDTLNLILSYCQLNDLFHLLLTCKKYKLIIAEKIKEIEESAKLTGLLPNGKIHGVFKSEWPKCQYIYKNGRLHGKCRIEKYGKYKYINYRKGLKHGESNYFHISGQEYKTKNYIGGIKHGQFVSNITISNDYIKVIKNYTDGIIQSTKIYNSSYSRLLAVCSYKNGQLVNKELHDRTYDRFTSDNLIYVSNETEFKFCNEMQQFIEVPLGRKMIQTAIDVLKDMAKQ
jgi:antitoxin component YwqK of YwqJK toxin-antitoxin module